MGGELQEQPTRPPSPSPGGPRVFENWPGNDVSESVTALHATTPPSSPPSPHQAFSLLAQHPPPLVRKLSFFLSFFQQKFYCDGRCMTGPSPQNLIGTALVVFVPSVIFNVFVARGLHHTLHALYTFIPRSQARFFFSLRSLSLKPDTTTTTLKATTTPEDEQMHAIPRT